jgi:hypothetical protein
MKNWKRRRIAILNKKWSAEPLQQPLRKNKHLSCGNSPKVALPEQADEQHSNWQFFDSIPGWAERSCAKAEECEKL